MNENRPKVGVSIFIIKDGKVLLGKRKNAHGDGTWNLPGGHLEFNESLEGCAKREVLEETGLRISNITSVSFTNDIFKEEGRHYITLFMRAESFEGAPQLMEPDKCEKWGWFDWKNLPVPLFLPVENLLRQGFNLFEEEEDAD